MNRLTRQWLNIFPVYLQSVELFESFKTIPSNPGDLIAIQVSKRHSKNQKINRRPLNNNGHVRPEKWADDIFVQWSKHYAKTKN